MTTLRVDVLSLITYPICSVVFYFNLNYTIASLLCSAAAICSSYYDWHVLSLEAPALYKSAIRNFFYAVLYLFVLSVYPPHTFRWWTGLVGFLLCMIKIAETIAPPEKRTCYIGALVRMLGPLFLVLYSLEISPQPDLKLDTQTFSLLRAIAIFGYILAWVFYSITATCALMLWIYPREQELVSQFESDDDDDEIFI